MWKLSRLQNRNGLKCVQFWGNFFELDFVRIFIRRKLWISRIFVFGKNRLSEFMAMFSLLLFFCLSKFCVFPLFCLCYINNVIFRHIPVSMDSELFMFCCYEYWQYIVLLLALNWVCVFHFFMIVLVYV